MRTTTIRIKLDAAGIDRAISQLEEYKRHIQRSVSRLLDSMCKEGEWWAVNSLGHIDTGETLSTIAAYREGNRGLIEAAGHAIWIEFGTGPKGLGSPHPSGEWLNEADWQYCSGPTIRFENGAVGWYYPADEDDPDTEWIWTQGIPAQHFMYDTAQHLQSTFRRQAQKAFSER